jgi:2-oxoglutarate ferredoxin oxidoreductase subunit alpha
MVEKQTRLLQGNEAIVEGAIAAGCRFFAGYPITPATEIAEGMSVRLPVVDGTFVQMEDEIASMGAIIGASLAGVKSMTATSGPGFSLMQENLGFACISEVPCVIANIMRGGPSTGLPTNPSQADVMQMRWGTHGDHPIIVLSPYSVEECFTVTIKAFNLSERYRVPVIVTTDEVVAHMREKIALPPKDSLEIIDRVRPNVPPDWYIPFEDNSLGVPPMSAFGDGYRYHITGLVHDVRGFPTSRADEVDAFIRRLHRKINKGLGYIQEGEHYLLDDAEVAIIAYGSIGRTAKQAALLARENGQKVGVFRPITLWPFMRKTIVDILKNVRAVIIPEMNMGQFSREVKRVDQNYARIITLNKVNGQVITPEEILKKLKEVY